MIRLKLEVADVEPGRSIRLVDAAELRHQLGEKRPIGLWLSSYRRGMSALVEGENIIRRHGPGKQTLISQEIAECLVMMSASPHGDEYRTYLIEVADGVIGSPQALFFDLFGSDVELKKTTFHGVSE